MGVKSMEGHGSTFFATFSFVLYDEEEKEDNEENQEEEQEEQDVVSIMPRRAMMGNKGLGRNNSTSLRIRSASGRLGMREITRKSSLSLSSMERPPQKKKGSLPALQV